MGAGFHGNGRVMAVTWDPIRDPKLLHFPSFPQLFSQPITREEGCETFLGSPPGMEQDLQLPSWPRPHHPGLSGLLF